MVIDPKKKFKKEKSSTVVGLFVRVKKQGNKARTTLFNQASRSSFELDTSKGVEAKENLRNFKLYSF